MDISDLIFPPGNQPAPGVGQLLIAQPVMNDPYFSRSVNLILDTPEDGGHFGLMLNKETDLTLFDLMPDWEAGKKVPVFCGGPVDMERMFLLHSLGHKLGDAHEILPGLFVGADLDAIIDYIDNDGDIDGKIRFFLGYCGWSPAQLEGEIRNRTWAIANISDPTLLLSGAGNEYWTREVKNLGDEFKPWLNVPINPSLN